MFFRSGGLNNREQSVGSNATSMTSTTLMTVSGDLSGIWYGFWLFYQLCYTNSSTACNKKYFIITWLQSVVIGYLPDKNMIWVKSQAHKKYSCFNEMKKVIFMHWYHFILFGDKNLERNIQIKYWRTKYRYINKTLKDWKLSAWTCTKHVWTKKALGWMSRSKCILWH